MKNDKNEGKGGTQKAHLSWKCLEADICLCPMPILSINKKKTFRGDFFHCKIFLWLLLTHSGQNCQKQEKMDCWNKRRALYVFHLYYQDWVIGIAYYWLLCHTKYREQKRIRHLQIMDNWILYWNKREHLKIFIGHWNVARIIRVRIPFLYLFNTFQVSS